VNNLNKTDELVTKFFAKCMEDPEVEFDRFVEAVSVSLGSSIGLRATGIDVPMLLDKADEGMRMGAKLSKQVKPVADILRSGIMPGVIVVSIKRKE
jgi:hypothetical protein